ncbi:methyltransferase family protein [Pseudomonas sp. HK3]
MNTLELLLPPLPLTAFVAVLMGLLNMAFPIGVHFIGQNIMATVLLVLGLSFVLPAAISFFKAKTTVDPRTPEKSKKLVISGLYKISRNPMYLGMTFCLFAISSAQGNVISLLLSIGFAVYLNRFQIHPEERFLSIKFGESYTQYCKNVRRWL